MKQIIYTTGVFETELTVFTSEDRPYYGMFRIAIAPRQRFKMRKTSQCLMRYEAEAGDKEYFEQLKTLADKAIRALNEKLMSASECKYIVKRYCDFADIYNKAVSKFETECKNVQYIELADETSLGCHAEYRFNDGVVEGVQPCKIGESWVTKINKPSIIK